MRNRSLQFLAVLFILTGTACSSSLYTPGPSTVKDPSVNMQDLTAGKGIYVEKCASCHGLKQPNKYTSDEWVGILDKMAPKAKLTADQRALVYKYVTNQKK